MTQYPEKAMTTFIIDVESMKRLGSNLMETFWLSQIKLKMLSSVFVISVGGFFVMRRIFAGEESDQDGDNQQGIIQSRLMFNVSSDLEGTFLLGIHMDGLF